VIPCGKPTFREVVVRTMKNGRGKVEQRRSMKGNFAERVLWIEGEEWAEEQARGQ